MRSLELKCFGIARDIVGSSTVKWQTDFPLTALQLQNALLEAYPAFLSLASVKLAVNQHYAVDSTPVMPGDEVAIIPPVSGG